MRTPGGEDEQGACLVLRQPGHVDPVTRQQADAPGPASFGIDRDPSRRQRLAIVGEDGDALARPARADGVPDDGWLAAYRAAVAWAAAAWADDATLDALVEVPWGKIPAGSRSPARCRKS